jgi:putative ABC transport system permease protein
LFLFTTSISIGIAALVAINSFKANLEDEIELQAKELLGADLEVFTNQLLTKEQNNVIDSIGKQRSMQTQFSSMVYFPNTDDTRLVQVRGIAGDFPYYGQIETAPAWAAGDLTNGNYALVDEKVMLQYNAELGDEIRIGNLKFEIRGKLKRVPGQNGISSTVAPIVYISQSSLYSTGLIKKGSRVTYSFFYKIDTVQELLTLLDNFELRLKEVNLNFDTVEKRKKDTTAGFKNMAVFLNLSAFIALLLGSIGVGSAVHIYLKEKNQTVAILRCLGVKSNQAFYIYLYQVLIMGSIGAMLGVGLGIAIQYLLPEVLDQILPVSITPKIYWSIALEGLTVGVVIALLFALIPLISLSKISPLQSIRREFEKSIQKPQLYHLLIYTSLALFLFLFAYHQIGKWMQAIFFLGGLGLTFVLLFVLAKGLIVLAKKHSENFQKFTIKQGIANLHRPNNQSILLLLTIGICTVLISTLLFSRFNLIQQISLADQKDRPNMVLFDIQSHQKEELKTLTLEYDLPVMQDVPVVTMRLKEVNGITKKMTENDSLIDIPRWVFNREYRVTFRDSLIDSETIALGNLQREVASSNDTIFISVSEGFAKRLKWKIGDELLFNVQGTLMKTTIGSFRKVDWRRVQTNFLILFPKGVLEEAPQFHVLVTKVDQSDVSARYQQAVVTLFPNVSIIDLELILKTVEEVLNKISFAVNFMAGFSVLTGLIVLAGSVVMSKSQRIKESVILRTLGASTKQVLTITAYEYLILGMIAALSGISLSLGYSWGITHFIFEQEFEFSWYYSLVIFLSITLGTLVIGLMNISPVLKKSPLEILRSEM